MLANPKGEVDELPVDRYPPIVTLLIILNAPSKILLGACQFDGIETYL